MNRVLGLLVKVWFASFAALFPCLVWFDLCRDFTSKFALASVMLTNVGCVAGCSLLSLVAGRSRGDYR